MAPSREGFTLVEALVALTLSILLVGMVTSVFMAQGDFYDDVVRRSVVTDQARAAMEVVTEDVRAATAGAVLVASASQLVLRVPLSVGVVCDIQSGRVSVYLPSGRAGLDTAAVTGYGIRSDAGGWDYYADTWADLYYAEGSAVKADCTDVGMNTANLPDADFYSLAGPGSTPSPAAQIGGAFSLHEDVELSIGPSGLDPDHLGLLRGPYGSTLVEYASGLGTDAGFSYRLKGSNVFSAPVTGGDLADINAVRVTAHAIHGDEVGGLDPYEYILTRDIPFRNEIWE